MYVARKREGIWNHEYRCGLRECPLAPVPRLADVEPTCVLPPVEGPRKRCARIPQHYTHSHGTLDQDGSSAGWSIIVREYELEGREGW